jgi:dolichyl-diphosphooligosaccharide--protein glycosyltransferase
MAPKNKGSKSPLTTAPLPEDPILVNRQVELEDETLSTVPLPKANASQPKEKQRLAYPVPDYISPATINNTQSLLRFVILGLISGAAIASRLFAVIRFESVIHEL